MWERQRWDTRDAGCLPPGKYSTDRSTRQADTDMQTKPPHQYRRYPNPSPLTRLTSAIAVCVAGTVWTGCTDDSGTGPTMPSIGTLVIEVSTSGQDIDGDGYLVLVDGSSIDRLK